MYVCGVTVYDYCHIGHARANIVFDVIFRYLRYAGYEVTYVRNYTDVDDKIIARANERGSTAGSWRRSSSVPSTRTWAAWAWTSPHISRKRPSTCPRSSPWSNG